MDKLKKLVLATNNKNKIKEIREIFHDFNIEILTKDDFRDFPDIEETGETLDENSLLKAKGITEFTGLPSLADDTGLEVKALDNAPGVYSARYAGEDASYDDNNRKLLAELKGKDDRSARFRCVITLYFPDGQYYTAEGIVNGHITNQPAGCGGFGYDPVFFVSEKGKTLAELGPEEKNAISHRGKALRKMKETLSQ